MKVFVNMKKMGSKRNSVNLVPYELDDSITNVRDLICSMVRVCVRDYNDRMENREVLSALSEKDLNDMAAGGKISFGINYGENKQDEDAAVENAILSFTDGIYRIFIDDRAMTDLDEAVTLTQNSAITFVRLTMLSGRLW